MAALGTLTIEMAANVARLQKDMEHARKSVDGAMAKIRQSAALAAKALGAIGIGLSVAALTGFIRGAINAADGMAKMAQKTGLTVEELAGVQLAFRQSGAEAASFQMGMAKLTVAISEGNKHFGQMGLSTKNADGSLKSTRQMLGEVADKFASYQDGAAKAALAIKLFGRSGAELIPLLNGGAQGLADYDEKARTLGLTLDTSTAKAAERFNDTLDLAGQGLQGIARQVAAQLLPTLQSLAGNLLDTATSGDTMKITVDAIAAGLRSMVTAALVGVTAIKALFRAVEMANKSEPVWNELTQEFEVVNEGWGTFKDTIIADWEELNTRLQSVWSGGGGETMMQMTEAIQRQAPALAELTAKTKELEAARKDLRTPEEKDIDRFKENLEQMQFEARLITATNTEREIAIKLRELEMSEINKASAAYQNLAEGFKKVITYRNALQELKDFSIDTDQMTFSDSLTSGISNAVKAFERLNHVYDEQAEALKRIRKAREEANKVEDPKQRARDLEFINRREQELTSDSISYQLSAYGQMFGTLGQLYDEDSKERRRLNEAEKAFALAQIAIQSQQAITSAVASIASAGTGDPYTAIPRVLAMAALMAGVLGSAGIAFSGGGGGSAAPPVKQGSGTVLGDASAQSQSISRSYEMMEDWHVDEYAALRGIWDEMKNLNTNITGLVSGMVRHLAIGDGVKLPADKLGAAEKYWNELADFNQKTFNWLAAPLETGLNKLGESLFGKDSILGQIFILPDKILGGVLGWIGKGISSIFGGGTSYKLMESGVRLGEISIEELQAGVDAAVQEYAYIRKKTDGGMFGSTKRKYYYRYGEVDDEITGLFTQVYAGLSDTIVSLTAGLGGDMEKALSYVFSGEYINLKGMDAGEIHETISAVISTAGDTAAKEVLGDIILRYQKIDEGLMETAVRLYSTQEVIRSMLTQSGQEITDNLLEISQSLVMFAGDLETLQENYATYYDKFFTEQERFRHQYEYMAAALADLNLEFPESREGFRALVEAQDVTTEAGQRAYVALLDLAGVADELATTVEETAAKRRELELQIMELTGREVEALAIRRQMELDAMDKSLHFMQRRIWQLQDEQKALSEVTDARATYRTEVERKLSEATASQAELENALATAQTRLETARAQAMQRGIQDEINLWNTALQSAQQRISKWQSIVDSLSRYQAGMLTGPHTYLMPDQVLAEARRQFASASAADLPGAADTLLSAAVSSLTDPAAYREIFEQVQGKISGTLSHAERQLRAAERSATAADRQLETLSIQMELTREANDLAVAQAEYAAAKKALDESQYTAEIAYWQAELDRLDALTESQDNMASALERYQSALVAAIAGGYDNLTRRLAEELAALNVNPGYADGGIATGPQTGYLTTLHGTEAIIPLKNGSVPVQMQGTGDAETKALLRGLLAEIREDKELSKKVHRILDRVTGGEDSLQVRDAS